MGILLAELAKIILFLKNVPGTNTLAYFNGKKFYSINIQTQVADSRY